MCGAETPDVLPAGLERCHRCQEPPCRHRFYDGRRHLCPSCGCFKCATAPVEKFVGLSQGQKCMQPGCTAKKAVMVHVCPAVTLRTRLLRGPAAVRELLRYGWAVLTGSADLGPLCRALVIIFMVILEAVVLAPALLCLFVMFKMEIQ